MALSLSRLRTLKAIMETGSLSSAADRLHVTQPALSRALRDFEDALGVKLFERRPNGMLPTEYATALMPYASQIAIEATRAAEEVALLKSFQGQMVRIGAVGSIVIRLLPDLIRESRAEWPKMAIRVLQGTDDELRDALIRGEIDVAIGTVIPEDDRVVAMDRIKFSDICAVLAASDHPLQGRRNLAMSDLVNYDWTTLPSTSLLQRSWRMLLREQGQGDIWAPVEASSFPLMQALVEDQGFLTWGPISLFAHGKSDDRVEPLDVPSMRFRRHFSFYRRRHGRLPPPVVRFMATVERSPTIKQWNEAPT